MKKIIALVVVLWVASTVANVVADCTKHCEELEWSCAKDEINIDMMESLVPARAELIWSTTQTNSSQPDNVRSGQWNARSYPAGTGACPTRPLFENTDGSFFYPRLEPANVDYSQYCNYCQGY